MPTTISTVTMLLFCATLAVTYLLARLGRLPIATLWIGAIFVNSLFFCLYTLTRQLILTDALLSGVILGLVFTTGSILLGQFFRQVTVSVRENAHAVLFPESRRV